MLHAVDFAKKKSVFFFAATVHFAGTIVVTNVHISRARERNFIPLTGDCILYLSIPIYHRDFMQSIEYYRQENTEGVGLWNENIYQVRNKSTQMKLRGIYFYRNCFFSQLLFFLNQLQLYEMRRVRVALGALEWG